MAELPRDEVRRYVKELRLFYKEVLVSVCIFVFCLIAWMSTGGSFWPLWVFFAFSVNIAIRAVSVGVINEKACMSKLVSFFGSDWEDRQIDRYIKTYEAKHFCDDSTEKAQSGNGDGSSSGSAAASQEAKRKNAKLGAKPVPEKGRGRSTREGE
jgi:hypothetical protein